MKPVLHSQDHRTLSSRIVHIILLETSSSGGGYSLNFCFLKSIKVHDYFIVSMHPLYCEGHTGSLVFVSPAK